MSTTYTVGLIGAGGIAEAHLPAWLAIGVDVVVFSIDGRGPELVSRHGGGRVVDTLDELLAACDAVDICTPTFTHLDLTRRAAAAGRHVLCEKPLAPTAADVLAMITACEDAGVQLYPAHVVRYFPAYRAVEQAVRDSLHTPPGLQRFYRGGSGPIAPWFYDSAMSGGMILDQMIHDIDFAQWISGDIVSAYATQNTAGSVERGDKTVVTQLVLTHGNGAIAHVTGVWARQGTTFRTEFEIAGDGWMLTHDSIATPYSFDGNQTGAGTSLVPTSEIAESPYLGEIAEIYAAFRGGAVPRVSAWDALSAIEVAVAAGKSLETAQPVLVDRERKVAS
jgi:predicted dehydrogenase